MGAINLKAVDDEATAKALANAGMLYYCFGLTQNEIAKRMQVSRSTVSNYLRIAREQGIVDIRINGTAFTLSSLSKEIREKYALTDVYISETETNIDASDLDRQVAILAAMALRDILMPGDRLGVAWSDTIGVLAEELPGSHIEDLKIYELLGGSQTEISSSFEACAARIGARLGGELNTMRCPAVASSSDLAEMLKTEPSISGQLLQINDLDRFLFSIEGTDANIDHSWSWLLKSEEADLYRKAGAVGLFCGRFLDKDGNEINGPLTDKTIAIDIEKLKKARKGILVSSGVHRMKAVLAAVKGGLVDYLVIDQDTAVYLRGH